MSGLQDYLASIPESYWAKPWQKGYCASRGFIQMEERPDCVLVLLPCCLPASIETAHSLDCPALAAIATWSARPA